jgi:hypothetical protein
MAEAYVEPAHFPALQDIARDHHHQADDPGTGLEMPKRARGSRVLIHGLRAFKKPFLNADWEKQSVEKYLGRKL